MNLQCIRWGANTYCQNFLTAKCKYLTIHHEGRELIKVGKKAISHNHWSKKNNSIVHTYSGLQYNPTFLKEHSLEVFSIGVKILFLPLYPKCKWLILLWTSWLVAIVQGERGSHENVIYVQKCLQTRKLWFSPKF